MQVGIESDIRTGLAPALLRDSVSFLNALARSVEEATTRIKERARAQIRAAFPRSRRIATTLRGQFYPEKPGKPPQGRIFSAWFNKRGQDVLYAFAAGLTIRAAAGKLLLVPADSAPGGKAMARAALEALGQAPRIALIRTRAGKLLLVERGDRITKILATLTPAVKVPKKLDFRSLEAEARRVLAERLIDNLAKAEF